MRTLIIAWSITLVVFIGGASWLQLSYHPADYKPADGETHTEAQDTEDKTTQDHSPQVDDQSHENDEEPAPDVTQEPAGDVTEDTPPEIKAPDVTVDYAISDPIATLTEEGPYGPLPVVANRQQPWRVYARPFGGSTRPKVALLVVGVGLSEKLTNRAISDLPGEVGLGFSPYSSDAAEQTAQSRKAGHEVFVMTPMEPNDYPVNDPGPHTLLTNLTEAENLDRLYFILSRFQGYVGIVNDMGSKFTSDDLAIGPIIKDIQRRGLMFVDARTSRFTVATNAARDLGVAHAANSHFIDNAISQHDIDSQLKTLVYSAHKNGTALGLARPYPITIERIRQWARTLDAQGIDLVPVTAIATVGARRE